MGIEPNLGFEEDATAIFGARLLPRGCGLGGPIRPLDHPAQVPGDRRRIR